MNVHDAIGNPTHPVLAPDMFMPYDGTADAPFFQRLDGLIYNFWFRALYHWNFIPRMDRIIHKYLGEDMPSISEIESKISLLLVTVNPIMNTVRPNIPTVINIEQMHIDKSKPLPKVSDKMTAITITKIYKLCMS